jgi:hypothetical protein
LIPVGVRRRAVLGGVAAAVVAACDRRSRDGETISPDELPPPDSGGPPRPDALVLTGPGVTLRLLLPVHLERMSDDPLAAVRIVSDAAAREAAMLWPAGEESPAKAPEVRPVGDGAFLELDPKADLARIGEASVAPRDVQSWRLGLADMRFEWPPALVADAYGGDIPRVELRRFDDPRDVMVVVRGPLASDDVPGLDDLIGPGQRESARDAGASPPWVEVTYAIGEQEWRQRHFRAAGAKGRIVLVTAQATAETARRVIADGDALARSLALELTPR